MVELVQAYHLTPVSNVATLRWGALLVVRSSEWIGSEPSTCGGALGPWAASEKGKQVPWVKQVVI